MSDSKTIVLETMRSYGRTTALALQADAETYTGTELHAQADFIPNFSSAILVDNMINRSIGFLVYTALGNVCKLLQPYDSTVYTEEPESYVSLWGFKWSTDPEKATEFVASSTSPYAVDECCTYDGQTYRSLIDNNVNSPVDYPAGWEVVT